MLMQTHVYSTLVMAAICSYWTVVSTYSDLNSAAHEWNIDRVGVGVGGGYFQPLVTRTVVFIDYITIVSINEFK